MKSNKSKARYLIKTNRKFPRRDTIGYSRCALDDSGIFGIDDSLAVMSQSYIGCHLCTAAAGWARSGAAARHLVYLSVSVFGCFFFLPSRAGTHRGKVEQRLEI